MKTTKLFLFVLTMLSLSINSCKKKSEEPTPTPTPAGEVCSGNGKNIYYPLDSNNTWSYSHTVTTYDQPGAKLKVMGLTTFSSIKYAVIKDLTNIMYTSERYLRADSLKNICQYNVSLAAEFIEVPASPVLNHIWVVENG